MLDFAELFWGGGTDFQTPLDAAAGVLEAEFDEDGTARGDIVLITDGECGVREEWMRAWNDRKHRLGFRVFGVAIGASRSQAAVPPTTRARAGGTGRR